MRLAARGARETMTGVEPVGDPDEARLLRAQALRIHVEALVAATLITGLALLLAARLAG